jgi:hypothetical protein
MPIQQRSTESILSAAEGMIRGEFTANPQRPAGYRRTGAGQGPQESAYLLIARVQHPEWSDKTHRTFAKAMEKAVILEEATGIKVYGLALRLTTRHNRSINVSRFAKAIDVFSDADPAALIAEFGRLPR